MYSPKCSSGERSRRVLIVVAPFLPMARPALGVGLLKAALGQQGVSCDVRHLQLKFADVIGLSLYEQISESTPTHDLVGEWIFTPALYGEDAPPATDFHKGIFKGGMFHYGMKFLAEIERCRECSVAFVRQCVRDIDVSVYDIVGFSSSFQQNVASLAIARELKRSAPHINIIIGGANCEGEMGVELHRRFSFIDIVCSGEGDLVFPELIRRLRSGDALEGVPGVTYRRGKETVTSSVPQSPVNHLNRLPFPDHSDFFRDFTMSKASSFISPQLTMETSRGCWWGQKHHCTFCGLNGLGMAYRSKSADRAYEEICYLVRTYGITTLFNTDNIFDPRYFHELLPKLEKLDIKLQLYYEMKSNLKKSQLMLLRRLGTTWFQPGIESLNSHVLSLMNKGVSGIQNVQLLKWAKELGFSVTWNVLCGFPGERPEDYEELGSWTNAIQHLQPPTAFSRFRLDRFSPMFNKPEEYGLRHVRPYPAYARCYPFSEQSLRRIAYFFECDSTTTPETAAALREAWTAIQNWRRLYGQGTLSGQDAPDGLLISDTRMNHPYREYRLTGIERSIYLAADAAHSVSMLRNIVQSDPFGYDINDRDLRAVLQKFVDSDLMLKENDMFLSLALISEHVQTHLNK